MTSGAAKIGLLDSGIGGFTVLQQVRRALPQVPCLYFGDLKHVPYGHRPLTEIRQIAEDILRWLIDEGCSHLVVACNTSSAALHDSPLALDRPLLDVVTPLRQWILDHPGASAIGVVANPVTAQREIHAQMLRTGRRFPRVLTVSAPTLVDLLEGHAPEDEIDSAVEEAVRSLLHEEIQALVFGCTHYPLARASFGRALGPGVELLDTGALVASRLAKELGAPAPGDHPAVIEFVTSAPSDDFGRWIGRCFPGETGWTLRTHDPFPSREPVAV